MSYQTLPVLPVTAAPCRLSPAAANVLCCGAAFLATLLTTGAAASLWTATVPLSGPVAVPPMVARNPTSALRAIAALPEPRVPEEEDPGADIVWLEDDAESFNEVPSDSNEFAVFMAVRMRFSRQGRHKRPFYRLVAADSRMPRDGRFLEVLGTYDPLKPNDDPARVSLNVERILHWLEIGAHPSDTAAHLFMRAGLKLPPWLVKRMEKEKANRLVADKSRKAAAAKKIAEAKAAEAKKAAPAK